MKKISSLFILLVFAFTLVIPFTAHCENPPLTDNAGLLTAENAEHISSLLGEIRETYGYDVAVYTENDNPAGSAMERAYELFSGGGYGMGENNRGLMFYICNGSGKYNVVSYPEGETVLTTEACDYIAERCAPYLNDSDFYNAFLKYYLVTTDLFEKELDGEEFRFGKNPPLIDNAGLLTTQEFVEISDMLYNIRETYNIDVAVYTENETDNTDAVAKADDIYDYNGYGMGENDRGMIYYVCMSTRNYALSTHPYGETPFSNEACDYLGSLCRQYLSEGDYYSTFSKYAENAEYILEKDKSGETIDYSNYTGSSSEDEKHYVALFVLLAVIPSALAFGLTKHKQKKMNTAVMQSFAEQYKKPGSMNIEQASDIFLYSTVSRTRRQESSSSGGGSHTSSSGRSHGGSSGSF